MIPKEMYCRICGGYLANVWIEADAIPSTGKHTDLQDCVEVLSKRLAELHGKLTLDSSDSE